MRSSGNRLSSFSIFCMRMGRAVTTETLDEGGPTSVTLPDSITTLVPTRSLPLHKSDFHHPAGCHFRPACRCIRRLHPPYQRPSAGDSCGFWAICPAPDQIMPDVGTFAGCHALKQLTLPPQLKMLGAHSFNSSGLKTLTARDAGCENWSHTVTVAVSAFDHTAALLWLEKADVSGHVVARLGLPVARG